MSYEEIFLEIISCFELVIKTIVFFVETYVGQMDALLKTITTVTVPPTVCIFLLKFYKHYKLVYSFFKENGLTRMLAWVIVIHSRKNIETNIRCFIEFAMFELEGDFAPKEEWMLIKNKFVSKFIKEVNVTYLLEFNDSFILKNEHIAGRIEKYLNLLSEADCKKMLAIDETKVVQFLCQIKIKNGYSVPLVPIVSINQNNSEDWHKVGNLYRTSVNINKMTPFEIASFYVWLMWVPSYCIIDKVSEYKLCAYGLGDESLVVPMIITNEIKSGEKLWEDILQESKKYCFGKFIEGTFKLMKSKDYFTKYRNRFSENSVRYCENIQNNSPFLIEYLEHEIAKQGNDLFTAYIWVMIYYTTEDESFDCQRCTALFEHANLADNKTVELLTASLKKKVILTFENIFSDKEYLNRTYYIPWAVNKDIEEEIKKEIRTMIEDNNYEFNEQLKNHICLDDSHVNVDEILDNIDDVFANEDVEYRFIDFNKSSDLVVFSKFYFEIYVNQFPDENERETLENIIRQAKRLEEKKTVCMYHCILLIKNLEVVGGIIGDYFKNINCAAIEFVTISDEHRRRGYATKLINKFIGQCNLNAKNFTDNKKIDFYFFEVEKKEDTGSIAEREIRSKRLEFWADNSAKILNFKYSQPSLDSTKEVVEGLSLGVRFIERKEEYLEGDFILEFLREYFVYAFNMSDVNENDTYKELVNRLTGKKIEIKQISVE